MSGENNQEFVVPNQDHYAVEIDFNGCIDTSDCFSILELSVHESALKKLAFNIFPNPCNSQFNIAPSDMSTSYKFRVFTSQGKEVYRDEAKGPLLIEKYLPQGIYFVQIISGEHYISKKLIVN